MKLDIKDIDALSKSRVNRLEGNKQMYWLVGVAIAMLVGIFLVQSEIETGAYFGYGIALVAFVAYIWNMNTLTKKQKIMKAKLIKEWESEGGNG